MHYCLPPMKDLSCVTILKISFQKDHGWNGLVRELMDHRADLVVTSFKITPNRSEQVDFSVPFLETGIAITVALREGAISPTAFLGRQLPFWSQLARLFFHVYAYQLKVSLMYQVVTHY